MAAELDSGVSTQLLADLQIPLAKLLHANELHLSQTVCAGRQTRHGAFQNKRNYDKKMVRSNFREDLTRGPINAEDSWRSSARS